VVRQTAAGACAALVRGRILDGGLAPGDRLPAERELAVQLGVTRVTLRSALHLLVAEGLISQVQGRGTTVRDWRRAGGPGLLGEVLRRQTPGPERVAAVADLLAVRRAVAEVVLGRLQSAEVEVAPLRAAVDDFDAEAARETAGPDDHAAADLAVLAALLDACGSAVLPLCLHPVARALGALPELRAAVYRVPSDNVAGWRAVVAWLELPAAQRPAAAPVLALLAARDEETLALLRAPERSP
jgi:DNA-binding FadR family transcriptional regulator